METTVRTHKIETSFFQNSLFSFLLKGHLSRQEAERFLIYNMINKTFNDFKLNIIFILYTVYEYAVNTLLHIIN